MGSVAPAALESPPLSALTAVRFALLLLGRTPPATDCCATTRAAAGRTVGVLVVVVVVGGGGVALSGQWAIARICDDDVGHGAGTSAAVVYRMSSSSADSSSPLP